MPLDPNYLFDALFIFIINLPFSLPAQFFGLLVEVVQPKFRSNSHFLFELFLSSVTASDLYAVPLEELITFGIAHYLVHLLML